ncbi:Smad nuclear-interacting protein 1, partial [Coelomomyces lativittatus]
NSSFSFSRFDVYLPYIVDIRPYLIDLNATNGTFLNNVRLEDARYYELFEKDMIRFGQSTREYVFMNADSLS